jgi:hypothetical protein
MLVVANVRAIPLAAAGRPGEGWEAPGHRGPVRRVCSLRAPSQRSRVMTWDVGWLKAALCWERSPITCGAGE